MRLVPTFVKPPEDVVIKMDVAPADIAKALSTVNKTMLQELLKQLDPALVRLVDSIDPKLAARIATVQEPDKRKFAVSEGFAVGTDIDGRAQLVAVGRAGPAPVLCRGGTGDILSYVSKFAPNQLSYVVGAVRKGILQYPTKFRLDEYREHRNFSPGLDRLSKMEQLPYLEQDKTFNKFRKWLPPEAVVIHYGAGRLFSGTLLSMADHEVIAVDPAGRSSRYFKTTPWQDFDEDSQAFNCVVSDMAIGGDYGMSEVGLQEFLDYAQLLYNQGVTVISKASINCKIYGEVVNKPRPHNNEVIVKLGDDPLDTSSLQREVEEANRKRNLFCFTMKGCTDFKPVFNTSTELRHACHLDYKRFLALGSLKIRTKRFDRNAMLADAGKKKKERYREIEMLCRDKHMRSKVLGENFCLLPFMINVQKGPLYLSDPGFGTPEFAVATIFKTSASRKYDIKYVGGEWCRVA